MELLVPITIIFIIVTVIVRARSRDETQRQKPSVSNQTFIERFALITGGLSTLTALPWLYITILLGREITSTAPSQGGLLVLGILMQALVFLTLPVFILNIVYLVSSKKKRQRKYPKIVRIAHNITLALTILMAIPISNLIGSFLYYMLYPLINR